jgi:hypothetical protein
MRHSRSDRQIIARQIDQTPVRNSSEVNDIVNAATGFHAIDQINSTAHV